MITKFQVPFPPSVNSIYKTIIVKGRPIRALTTKGKKWKENAKLCALSTRREKFAGPVAVTVLLCSPRWHTKAGEIRRMDLDDRLKILFDSLEPLFEQGDEQIWRIVATKVVSDEEAAFVVIRPWEGA